MTSSPSLLIHPEIEAERLEAIQSVSSQLQVMNTSKTDEALEAIEEVDAFFGKITPELLSRAKNLKWIQSPTASLEHYLFPELIEHPCVLTNMRGLFSDVIADHVFGFVLMFARNFNHYLLHQLAQHWEPMGGEENRVGMAAGPGVVNAIDRAHLHLGDATMGIVGLGAIGEEIARRARAFSMRVVAVDPVREDCPAEVSTLYKPEQLSDLLAESDFVVIAAPHTPETVKMFRRQQFQQMKPSAFLINIGRGAIVDLKDLSDAIQADEIAGAGLDVFEEEPLPSSHPLWNMVDRVLITPHVAGYSPRIAERHLALLLENVRRFVNGESLKNQVDKRRWF